MLVDSSKSGVCIRLYVSDDKLDGLVISGRSQRLGLHEGSLQQRCRREGKSSIIKSSEKYKNKLKERTENRAKYNIL